MRTKARLQVTNVIMKREIPAERVKLEKPAGGNLFTPAKAGEKQAMLGE